MDKPFPAYSGAETYVFACYAHKDAERVYADLRELDRNDVNVWYDEGIPAGRSWRAEIATAIKGAQKLLFFISEASLSSAHCLREVDYALNNDVEIVPIYLDDSSLPGELELVLNRVHALFRENDSRYIEHLLGALRDRAPLTPLLPGKKRTLRVLLPSLVLGLGVLAAIFWTQSDPQPPREREGSNTIAEPNAFDRYLNGLELIERWDKDDNLDSAIRLFGEAAALDPSFALTFARLADALRIRYALTGDETWLDEASKNIDEAVRLNAGLAPVQVTLGRLQAARGNMDLAFAALERGLAIDPNDASANQAIAVVYARQGRLDDAEASFEKALSLDPDNLATHDAYANFLLGQSRFEDAARQWQTVIRLAPDHHAALVNLGSALSGAGRFPEAITMYQRAIEIRPTYMAYSNLGTAYGLAQRYADALEVYAKALEINDKDWLAWGNLAYVYSWMPGQEQEAIEAFDRAIELAESARLQNPRDPWVNSDLGLYYAKTDKSALARQRSGTALTLSPDSGEIQAAAAEVYELTGDRGRAIELAQKSLQLGFSRQQMQRNPEFSDLLEDPRMQGLRE